MRLLISLIALGLVAGCSSPPKPRECSGEFRPVNKVEQKGASLDAATSKFSLCTYRGNHEQG